MSRIVLLLVGLIGCSDYTLEGKDAPGPGFDTGDSVPLDTSEDSVPPPEELCNGVDDDGDGLVDEGYPDADADGIADCLDNDCVATEPGPRSEADAACVDPVTLTPPPAHPWDVVEEWAFREAGSASTPAVGDLDADGAPEVVFVDYTDGGRLVVLDGATGVPEWSWIGPEENAGPAIADLDGDGYGEIVVTEGEYGMSHTVRAFSADGAPFWWIRIGPSYYAHPAIGDLDGDGTVEVVVNEYILDGATGVVDHMIAIEPGHNFGSPALADLDGDGRQEILLANRVYDAEGRLLWTCGPSSDLDVAQPAQLDVDPEGEVVVSSWLQLTVCDDDGSVLWTMPSPDYVAPVAAADFDGDGIQELVVPMSWTLNLVGADGGVRWSVPIEDPSGASGPTVWDLDLDGAPEVFYRDEHDFIGVDGATGAVMLRIADQESWTSWETPVVADIDADGAGEILYVYAGEIEGGIVALGSAEGDWPPTRPVYNEASYADSNVTDTLAVPVAPIAPWLQRGGVFRGQISSVLREGLANARVAITDVCVASCDPGGRVEVWVQVWNDGDRVLPAATTVTLSGTVGEVEIPIESRALGTTLAAGTSTNLLFETTTAQAGSSLVVTVSDAGEECHGDDDSDRYADLGCP